MNFCYIIFVSVILLKLSLFFTDSIYSIGNGSLNSSWILEFRIYADDIDGVILYCIDFSKNQLVMDVLKARNEDKYVRITYKNIQKYLPLNKIYDCESCRDGSVDVLIRYKNGEIYANSNNVMFKPMSNYDGNKLGINDDHIEYPIPSRKFNDGQLLIMIGNIVSKVQKNSFMSCLRYLYFNNKPLDFSLSGRYMTHCNWLCRDNTCNGGVCHNNHHNPVSCDCSSTPLNGIYCNKELRQYIKRESFSYEKKSGVNRLYFKMSYHQLSIQNHCLIEIIDGGNRSDVIWINDNHRLMMNHAPITTIHTDNINFVSVNLSHHQITLKTTDDTKILPFTMSDNIRINIGFTQKGADCQIFKGLYDVYIKKEFLRRIRITDSNDDVPRSMVKLNKWTIRIWIIIGILGVLLIMVVIFVYKKRHVDCCKQGIFNVENMIDAGLTNIKLENVYESINSNNSDNPIRTQHSRNYGDESTMNIVEEENPMSETMDYNVNDMINYSKRSYLDNDGTYGVV